MELPAILKKKVGPFPVGVWLVIGAAGIGVVYFARRQGMLGGLPGNEGYDMYGVPVETGEPGYGDVPYTPAPPVYGQPGGGGYVISPYPVEQGPDISLPPISLPPDTGAPVPYAQAKPCTKPTKPAGFGMYPDAPNRNCPRGWHQVTDRNAPCFGLCVPN